VFVFQVRWRARRCEAETLRALHAVVGRLGHLRLVERLAGDGIGEGRRRSTVIDRALRALGLQVVQDARELGDLIVAEIELVSEKA
jgi:hypothetical protein